MTAPDVFTGFARYVDGIPYVRTTAERNARYPTPTTDFRVMNGETGGVERWTGAAWAAEPVNIAPVLALGSTTPRSLATRFADMKNVKDFGAIGNGSADDTAAFLAAATAAAASGGRVVYVPSGAYLFGSTLALTSSHQGVCFVGQGRLTQIFKGFNGSLITVTGPNANYIEFHDLAFLGQAQTFTGKGLVVSGTSVNLVVRNCHFENIQDTHLEIGANAAQYATIIGLTMLPSAAQTIAQNFRALHLNGPDSGARHRRFTNIVAPFGIVDVDGTSDQFFTSCALHSIDCDSASAITTILGGMCGPQSTGTWTLSGSLMTVIGLRIAGNVVLDANFDGVFVGNVQSSGTFTDSSTANQAIVFHHALGAAYTNLNKHRLSGSVNPMEVAAFRFGSDAGNADFTLTLDQGPMCINYNTAITADRAVNLPASARDGCLVRVVRRAAATGAFNVNVGTGPLKALAAASTWCDVMHSGSAWVLVAAGTL